MIYGVGILRGGVKTAQVKMRIMIDCDNLMERKKA